jgi:hypothetical protein
MPGVVEVTAPGWTGVASFALTLTYANVAGTRWRTSARFIIDVAQRTEGRYEGLEIEPVERTD